MKKWIITCNPNRFAFIENVGASIFVIGLFTGFVFMDFEKMFAISLITTIIGILVIGTGVQLRDYRTKEEMNETT